MLVLLIEQCLMLFLIVGRLMLPSDMTRDELAQLVLGYIGAAADILEFFDSFKVSSEFLPTCKTFIAQPKFYSIIYDR